MRPIFSHKTHDHSKFIKPLICVLCVILLSGLLLSVIALATGSASGADDRGATPIKKPVGLSVSWKASEVSACSETDVSVLEELAAHSSVLQLDEGGWAEWECSIPQEGTYVLDLSYMALPWKKKNIELMISIDGVPLIDDSTTVILSRIWEHENVGEDGSFRRDNNDNEIRPDVAELQEWQQETVRNKSGYADGLLELSLAKGTHTLRIEVARESLALDTIAFSEPVPNLTYDEYRIGRSASTGGNAQIKLQAERVTAKSDSSIYPDSDYTDAAMEPSDPSKVRLNLLGTNWDTSGQWIEYRFYVEEAGDYALSFRYKQNSVRGFGVCRQIWLDGEVPFREMEKVLFAFGSGWQMKTLGNEQGDYLFSLSEGWHVLRVEVVLGDVAEILSQVTQQVSELNTLYRNIIMITGTSPDPLYDYYLDRQIPTLMEDFARLAEELIATGESIDALTGQSGGQSALFNQLAAQLKSFVERPSRIQSHLDAFKSNISSLADLILSLKKQPMSLDYILLTQPNQEIPSAGTSLWNTICYKAQAFIASFFEDYSAVGSVYESEGEVEPLTVWVSANDLATSGSASGKEQLTVIKRLIDEEFVPETGIPVNVSLVDSSTTLMQAVMAGSGPDVALIVPESTVINLAMRGALVDLQQFSGFDQDRTQFYSSAFIPYIFDEGIYGMPETQNFYMAFYRTDIFEEFGLTPPETWDDFYRMVAVLQKSNMDVGIPEDSRIFETLLLQNNGSFYTEDLSATGFDTTEALEAFKQWTEFYGKYDFPLNFNAFNRFRTGEMPYVLMNYSFYNQLVVAAPEISGQWKMVSIPGTMTENGINRTQSSAGTCGVILSDSAMHREAYELLSWWCSSDIQQKFGNEIETMMGAAARYNTANVEALSMLPWSDAELEVLNAQWKSVTDVPNAPGSYYLYRCLTNAFRRVVIYEESPREVLARYNSEINKEIERKRQELGLDD